MAKDNAAAKKAAWAKGTAKAAKTWKSSRKAKGGGGFEDIEIEDGTYPARLVKATADVSKKGQPYVNLTFVVLGDSDAEGLKPRASFFLLDDDEERQAAKQASFAKAMSGAGYDVEALEMAEVPELVAEVMKDRPFVEIYVKNWSNDNGKSGYNVYVNHQLSDEEKDEHGIDGTEGDDDEDGEESEKKDKPKGSPPKKKAAVKKKAGSRS